MNIKPHSFRITGLSPLLMANCAHMKHDAGGIRTQPKKLTPEQQAEQSAYKLPSGQLYMPALCFRESLLYAAKGKKFGKATAWSVLASAVFLIGDNCLLVDAKGRPLKEYEIDSRTAVNQHAGRIMVSRAKVPHWGCIVEFDIDEDVITDVKVVAELLNQAGTISGVGAYRVSCRGWFGRFKAELIS